MAMLKCSFGPGSEIPTALAGKRIDYPWISGANVTFRKAPQAKRQETEALDLLLEG